MKTRIGSAPRNFRKQLASDNRRLVRPAMERLDQVIARANDRHEQALAVDGIELTLWRRQNAGLLCTCHSNDDPNSITPNIQSSDLTEGDTNFSTDVVETGIDSRGKSQVTTRIQSGGTDDEFSIISLQDSRRHQIADDVLPYLEDEEFAEIENQSYFPREDGVDYEIERDADFDLDSSSPFFRSEDLQNQSVPPESDDEAARLRRSLDAILSGGESVTCGICFSSGWTEGYQLHNGRRIVLTTLDVTSLGGFIIDNSTKPNLFRGNGSSQPATWNVNFPTFIHSVVRISAWNNISNISSVEVWAKFKDATDFVRLTASVLNGRSGMDNTGTIIQVRPDRRIQQDASSSIFFTHIELIIELTPKLIGQIPQVEIAETFEFQEAIIQTNVEWPARITDISYGSVVVDQKHKRAWRVVSVALNKTSDSKIFSVETQVMLLTQKEPLDRLNIYRRRFVVNKNFKGLEFSQGSNQLSNNKET